MGLTERMAYIKGLAEGLKLDQDKEEVQVLSAIIDLLDDLTTEVSELCESYDELSEQVDAVDCDLAEVEEVIFGEDECNCGNHDEEWDDENLYEVTCPSCGEEICVDEDTLLSGEISCPKCSESLEFDFSDLKTEEEDTE